MQTEATNYSLMVYDTMLLLLSGTILYLVFRLFAGKKNSA